MTGRVGRGEGRRLFGADPTAYQRARPDYPERVYARLAERCGLGPGCRVLEVGPGSGLATRHLLEANPASLTLLEPDLRFAAALRALPVGPDTHLELQHSDFEGSALPRAGFDLLAAATSFHWIAPEVALARAGELLAPGGWLAQWWNVFGDPQRPDPFHEATSALLAGLAGSPSHPQGGPLPFALDAPARLAALQACGHFVDIESERLEWTLRLDAEGVRALYATFSPIARLAPTRRAAILDALAAVARDAFGGVVERSMVTPLYLARRARER